MLGQEKKGKKQEKDERRARGTDQPRGEFCAVLALCWGDWQCLAVPQVPRPAGGVREGARHTQCGAHTPKKHACR